MHTWMSRDLPVLRAIVEMTEEGETHPTPAEIGARLGMDEATADRALWALAGEQPPFFQYIDGTTFGGRSMTAVHDPTGHARRTVGAWPTPETLAESIVAALQQAADNEPDEVKRSRLRKLADAVGDVGKATVVGVLTNMLTGTVS